MSPVTAVAKATQFTNSALEYMPRVDRETCQKNLEGSLEGIQLRQRKGPETEDS